MPPLRPSTASPLPTARRTLALVLAVATLGAFAGAAWPMTPQAPVVLNGSLSAVGAVLVAVVLLTRRARWLHVATLALVAGVTAVVAGAASPGGTAGTAVSYVWIPLYAGFFFSRPCARGYVLLSVASFAGALAVNPFPGCLHVWGLTTVTAVAAVEVVGSLVSTLQRQATTDPLTGLLNREGLRRAAERLDRDCAARGVPLAVAVVDLDGFKGVNDAFGHEAGDRLLVELADVWRASLRQRDVAARLGGDEFVLLLPGTGVTDARDLLVRLRAAGTAPWSGGVALHPPGAALHEVLREADRQLYRAKRARDVVPAR